MYVPESESAGTERLPSWRPLNLDTTLALSLTDDELFLPAAALTHQERERMSGHTIARSRSRGREEREREKRAISVPTTVPVMLKVARASSNPAVKLVTLTSAGDGDGDG